MELEVKTYSVVGIVKIDDNINPMIISETKPLVGDRVKCMNQMGYYVITGCSGNIVTLVSYNSNIVLKVPISKVFHKILVPGDKLNGKVIGAIRKGIIRKGYKVLVSMVKLPGQGRSLYLKEGKAIVKPYRYGDRGSSKHRNYID